MAERLEELLEKSGEWGRYQKIVVFFISMVFIPLGFSVFAPVFTFHMPQHRCYIPEVDGMAKNFSAINQSSLEDYIPLVLSDDGKFALAGCERYVVMQNSTDGVSPKRNKSKQSEKETEECHDGWVYMDPEGRTSVSTEFNLVCGDAWKRPLLTTSLMLGLFAGSVLSGPIIDKFGRRRISLTCAFFNFIFTVSSGFSPSYEWMVASIIIFGTIGILQYSSNFVLAQEIVGRKRRAVVTCSINIFLSTGYMILPGVAYLLKDWRWIMRGSGAPYALLLPCLYFIPESPRWLASNGRNSEAYKILKLIARCNGKNPSIMKDFDTNNLDFSEKLIENPERKKKNKSSFLILATNSVMRTRSLIICWIWSVSFLCYYALAYNTSNLGGNNYWNCFIAAALDIPCHLLVTFCIQKFGRRSSVATSIGLAGLFLAISPALRIYHAAMVTFAMIGKFFAASAVGILYLYTSELYPTLLRNTGIGMASMSARLAGMIAPFLLFAGENGDRFIPFYVMAACGLLTAALCLFLPETKHKPLPDTMMDAVAMNKHRPFPFIPKRFRKRNRNVPPLACNSKDFEEDGSISNENCRVTSPV